MTQPPAPTDPVLARAAGGYRATLITQAVRMLCKAASVVVLARLVSPEDHGRFAMAATLFGFLLLFRDLGLGTAAIQARTLSVAQETALTWANALLGGVLGVAAFGLATPVARFYGDAAVASLLRTMSLAFPLIGLGGYVRARLQRELRFEASNRIETTSVVVGTAAMIGVGASGGGAYAFVAFLLLSEAVATARAWAASHYRPRGRIDWSSLGELLRTGGAVTVHHSVGFALQQLDTIVIGRLFGPHPLGLYNRANQLLALPHLHVSAPLSQVLLASLSRLPPHSPEFHRHAWSTVTTVAHLILPLFAICLALPEETVRLVLGPAWPGSAPLVQLLAVGASALAISSLAFAVNVAAGRVDRLATSAAFTLPVTAAAIAVGAYHGGVLGVAAGVAAANVLLAWPRIAWHLRDVPGGAVAFCAALKGPFTVFVAALAGLWMGHGVMSPDRGWLLRLAAGLGGGLAALLLTSACLPRIRKEWVDALDFMPFRAEKSGSNG